MAFYYLYLTSRKCYESLIESFYIILNAVPAVEHFPF